MNRIFFNNISADSKSEFQSVYLIQNLQIIKISTLFLFFLHAFIRIVSLFRLNELKSFPHFYEYNIVNWTHLLILPVFYFSGRILAAKILHKTKITIILIRIYTISFGIYLSVSGLLTSFIALHNPHNSLTFFMVAMMITSIILVLELQEILILSAMIIVTFNVLLFSTDLNQTQIIYNQIASVGLVTGFYFLSRYVYSYKCKMFLQMEQIRKNNLELEKVGKFKNEVLGIVAHDLRNPIAAIESIAALVQMDELDEELDDNMNMIRTSCEKAREIINDLLEAAQNESDVEFSTTVISVNKMLEKIVHNWTVQKHITNEIILLLPKKNLYAEINTEKFHRVIDNLISNAIKFSNISGRIEVLLKLENKQIGIEIRDYGIGIPKEMLPYIFERFSKASRSGLRGEASVGLGLNIVRRIVEKHHGTLEAESVENQGSVFRILLPQADASFTG